MAKSIDRCVCGDCSNVPMKGSDECFACFNETFVELMSGDSESMPSMDECYGSGRSCEIDGCFNTPQEDETICGSCWNKRDSSDTPGFPSEFDSSDCECSECLACVEEERAWYVRFEAGEFELKDVPDQKCSCGLGFSTGDDLCPRC